MEIIEQRNVAEFVEENYLINNANCAYMRYFPDERDGLKPVQRRILMTMYLYGGRDSKVKSAKVNGDVMSHFHPHGDIYDSMNNMVPVFENNIPFIKGVGNFGSIRGTGAASARYTNVILSDFTKDCFFRKEDVNSIIYKEAYNGKDREPIYLPTAYPAILVNGVFNSVTKGFSGSIPSYNFTELCKATMKLMKDPTAKLDLVPDICTGCSIIDNGTFESMIENGTGLLKMEATYEIDYEKNCIKITSLPLNSSIDKLTKALVSLKDAKKVEEIKYFEDNTGIRKINGKGTLIVDFQIYLLPGTNPKKFMEKLLKRDTGLRSSVPISINVVNDYHMETKSVRSLLLTWIEDRRTFLLTRHKKQLTEAYYDIQFNEILIEILKEDKIEETVSMARKAKNKEAFASALMKKYKINTLQAEAISKLPISGFTKEAVAGYKATLEKARKSKEDEIDFLKHPERIDEDIIAQLKEGIKKYGFERRSKVLNRDEKYILNDEYIVGISRDRYLKKILASTVSESDLKLTIGQYPYKPFMNKVENKSKAILFDSRGYVTKLVISELPETSFDGDGIPLSDCFGVSGDIKQVVWVEKVKTFLKKHPDTYALILTKNGYCKRTELGTILRTTSTKPVIQLQEGDEVACIKFVPIYESNPYSIIMYTNKGNGIHIDGKDLRDYGMAAKGIRYANLEEGETFIDAAINYFGDNNKYLTFIMSTGRCKRTELKYFAIMQKRDTLMNLTPVSSREKIVGIIPTGKSSTIELVFMKHSSITTIKTKNIPVTTRIAKGTKLVTFQVSGDKIIDAIPGNLR